MICSGRLPARAAAFACGFAGAAGAAATAAGEARFSPASASSGFADPNGSLTPSLNAIAFPLSQKLAVAPDDGQVDEFRTGMALRRIGDEKPAHIYVVHLLHRV